MPLPQNPLDNQVQLQVEAQPVSTFTKAAPAPEGPNLAGQLSQALSNLQPGLQKYLQQKQSEIDDASTAEARSQSLKDGLGSLAKVAAGGEYAQKSELFQKVYKDAQGKQFGVQAVADARQAYADQGLNATDDPAKFGAFMQDFVKQKLGGQQDPDFLAGALPSIEGETQRLTIQNAQEVSDNQKTILYNSLAAQTDTLVGNEATLARSQGRPMDFNNIGQSLNNMKNITRLLQIDPAQTNKMVAAAITDYAHTNADPTVLEAAKSFNWTDPVTGKSVPGPFSTADGRNALRDAQLKVESRQVSLNNQIFELEKREKDKAETAGTVDMLTTLVASPGQGLSPQQLSAGVKTFGKGWLTSYYEAQSAWRGTITGGRDIGNYDSPSKVAALRADLLTNPDLTPADIRANILSLHDTKNVQAYGDDAKAYLNGTTGPKLHASMSKVSVVSNALQSYNTLAVGDGKIAKILSNDPDVHLHILNKLTLQAEQYWLGDPKLQSGDPEATRKFAAWSEAQVKSAKEEAEASPAAAGLPPSAQ